VAPPNLPRQNHGGHQYIQKGAFVTHQQTVVTEEMLAAAAACAGLSFTAAERALMLEGIQQYLAKYEQVRAVPIDNSVPPALAFDLRLAGMAVDTVRRPFTPAAAPAPQVPADLEELAFAPVTQLSKLIRSRQVSSVALTEMYLRRLKRYDPALRCVVTLAEELALAQAQRADAELAAGRYRGPLHGIPWGAKDLLATRGIRTTWGAAPYADQVPDHDATVVQRLEAAGAVLVAKLTMGELAWGDVWFDGQTKNPWNIAEGSSGSSAGSAAATAAGLVGFSIGTETWGSIISPATRCRVTGLRPTFGRVSRYGAMALSWSMDKIGPICRSVEDCALVFDAIYGPDGKDSSVADAPFNWNPNIRLNDLRIGYLKSAFEEDREHKLHDPQTLDVLGSLGADLIPIELPNYPIEAMSFILAAEAAAAFDELTRGNRDDLLVRQCQEAWPNVLRQARLIPAVEYIQANRLRTLVMREMAGLMDNIDLYVAFGATNLLLTNLTGHPAVVVPTGVAESVTPTSMTFIGRLYGEATALAVAKAYQDASGFHLRHPPMDFPSA
jgi:Asp-tRNA(Asn)/Glu-tRNA(Gln) amidotransferase A subunit family amidase